jgi:hypothetical protein
VSHINLRGCLEGLAAAAVPDLSRWQLARPPVRFGSQPLLYQSAARLCEADTVSMGRPKGESFYFDATYGFSPLSAD